MNSIAVRRSLRTSAVLALLALGGCAGGMTSAECSGANWYDLGYRDARYKMQSRVDQYAHQCGQHGVNVDAAGYEQGLRQGRYDFPDRMT
jgi:hypothetical protein